MSENKPLLELDFPFGKVDFYSLDQVEAWVKKELDFWQWPDGFDRHPPPGCRPRTIIDCLRSPLDQINPAVKAIRNNHDEKANDRLVADLRNRIGNAYKPYDPNEPRRIELLHSSQPRAQYVRRLIGTDPVRAAFVAAFFTRVDVQQQKQDKDAVLDGAVTGILFDLGIKGSCEAEKAALEQLRQEWTEERLKAQATNEQNAETAKDWRTTTEDDRKQQKETFDELIKTTAVEIDDFKKHISAEIALKGPVEYWQRKARDHTVKSRWFGGFTIVAFVIVGGVIIAVTECFAPNLSLDEIKLRHIAFLGVGATIGVWFIRVLVRNYLSHVHLSHDAAERVAMMQTYLALIKEGKLEDNHRNLILQALFRPASTGIVKDDAAPPFMTEWLKRTTGTDMG